MNKTTRLTVILGCIFTLGALAVPPLNAPGQRPGILLGTKGWTP